MPEHTLRLGFDFVVAGEGESAFPQLMKSLRRGDDPSGIPGLAFLDAAGKFRMNPPGPPVSLDDYPPFAAGRGLFNPIEITRGSERSFQASWLVPTSMA